MQIMGIVNEERAGFVVASHHFHEGAFTLFGFAGNVAVFFRSQIIIQCEFEVGRLNRPISLDRFLDLSHWLETQ